jgi:1-acyl-sn-glycerol-3-phosphate acyltransferase
MLVFWAAALPFAALFGFPWTYVTKDINFLYNTCMWVAWNGVRIAGVKVRTIGLEKIDPVRTYIFMSNHISNLDPPVTLPLIPRRTSVMVKKELFNVPILGRIMHIGSLVPVDRGNRDSGARMAAVRDALDAIRQGLNMTIYVEGKRSFDGKLLPFKKGPFYLAEECKVAVVPITISGTEEVMPKARFAISPGTVTVQFHDPIEPKDFGERDSLMAKVRAAINSGLPAALQEPAPQQD